MVGRAGLVSATRARVQEHLAAAVEGGALPGGVILVGDRVGPWPAIVAGVRRYGGEAVTADTRYDLASVTKVVGCLSGLLRLADAGEVHLSDTVGQFLGDVGADGSCGLGGVTLEALATHTSGLPASRPLAPDGIGRERAVRQALATPLDGLPGTYVYSDLGVIVLTTVLERVASERIDRFLTREVFGPLGMASTGYGPLPAGTPVAATEHDPERGGVQEGSVHDENAWGLEGVSGHAGLFAPASDLQRFAHAWLTLEAPFASRAWLEEALADRSRGEGPRRGLLWHLSQPDWHFGPATTPAAYGHTGFTGTSVVIDPGRGWSVVLLTNRVHPTRERTEPIARLRRQVHTTVSRAFAEAEARPGAGWNR